MIMTVGSVLSLTNFWYIYRVISNFWSEIIRGQFNDLAMFFCKVSYCAIGTLVYPSPSRFYLSILLRGNFPLPPTGQWRRFIRMMGGMIARKNGNSAVAVPAFPQVGSKFPDGESSG